MLRRLMLAAVAVAVIASSAFGADLPERPREGFGVFLVVLGQKYAGDGSSARPLDVAQFGGVLHERREQVLIVTMPLEAWSRVEAQPGVAYVQRVWMGEPTEGWTDSRRGTPKKLRIATHEAESEELREAAVAPASWDSNVYAYDGSGNITAIGGDTYAYDSAGRLVSASVGGTPEQYAYDAFGNLTAKSTNGKPSPIPPVDTGSNRFIGYPYDVAGNVTSLPGAGGSWEYASAYEYDAVGMPVSVQGHTGDRIPRRMIYGADDDRIAIMTDSNVAKIRIRGLDGKVLREFRGNLLSGTWEWVQDYVYADGKLVAAQREDASGGRLQFHLDHLGSTRLITRADKTRISEHRYFPFGVEHTDSVAEVRNFAIQNNRVEPMKFTGHERDFFGYANVDGADHLDYMHARYYDGNLGRFLSIDPALDLGKTLHEPQLWNRYSYVGNNPLGYTDPAGKLRIRAISTGNAGGDRPFNYAITFETRMKKIAPTGGSFAKRFLGPLKQIPAGLEKGVDLLVGKEATTDPKNLKGVSAITGFSDLGKFEERIHDAFLALGAKTVGGGAHYNDRGLLTLQKAIDNVLKDMVASGEITQKQADQVRKEYDVMRLRDKADSQSVRSYQTDDITQ